MLGIVITYFNFPEFLPKQIANIKKHVKVPYKIFVVDDSNDGLFMTSTGAVIIRQRFQYGNPSNRHQNAVNLGMNVAKLFCDRFLIFDNDMIFLTDLYHEPTSSMYMPIVSIVNGKPAVFPWLNLLYTDHFHVFEFKDGSDSGGNFPIEGAGKIKNTTCEYDFIPAYKALCERYSIAPYYDVLDMNGAIVFHFRAMSNYTGLPEEFMEEKRQLIMRFSEL
jgi:hypothetical protein